MRASALGAPAVHERLAPVVPCDVDVLSARPASRAAAAGLHRASADFTGVDSPLLRDGAALSGLVLSAAAAAGLSSAAPPQVRELPRDGLAVVLLLALGHLTVHTVPAEGTLLVDLLVPVARDPAAAIAVFARKLGLAPAPDAAPERA